MHEFLDLRKVGQFGSPNKMYQKVAEEPSKIGKNYQNAVAVLSDPRSLVTSLVMDGSSLSKAGKKLSYPQPYPQPHVMKQAWNCFVVTHKADEANHQIATGTTRPYYKGKSRHDKHDELISTSECSSRCPSRCGSHSGFRAWASPYVSLLLLGAFIVQKIWARGLWAKSTQEHVGARQLRDRCGQGRRQVRGGSQMHRRHIPTILQFAEMSMGKVTRSFPQVWL